MKKPIRKVLKNGMRILVVPMKESPTVTTLVLVEAGSKYETKEVNGISHFLEHMFFKGTKKRKPREISYELDSLGSISNAFTGEEYTGYYAKSRSKNFKKITDVISDIYLNSELPEEEIKKERGVILAEIDMYEDIPRAKARWLLNKLMYGDQPIGWGILGPKENIKKISRDDFLKYKKSHYVAEKTAVIVAGNVDSKIVFKEIENKFKKIDTNNGGKKNKVIERQTRPEVDLFYKKTDQTHFALGFRSFRKRDKRNFSIGVLSAVLGRGMSSRLFTLLREQMGVAYYVRSLNNTQTDVGLFKISAGVDPKRTNEVIEAILKELRSVKNKTISKEEIDKAKEYMIGTMKMNLESSDSVAEWFGDQEILRKEIRTPEYVINQIKKVTPASVKKVANEIFQNKKMNLAIVGPHKDKKVFLKNFKI